MAGAFPVFGLKMVLYCFLAKNSEIAVSLNIALPVFVSTPGSFYKLGDSSPLSRDFTTGQIEVFFRWQAQGHPGMSVSFIK